MTTRVIIAISNQTSYSEPERKIQKWKTFPTIRAERVRGIAYSHLNKPPDVLAHQSITSGYDPSLLAYARSLGVMVCFCSTETFLSS